MAVLAIGVAGAAIGGGAVAGAAVAGGATWGAALASSAVLSAASLGWAVGIGVGSYLFGPGVPDTSSNQAGPRIGDTLIKGGSYGQMISRVWGKDRLGGGLIWKLPLREEIVTTSSSTGGGGKGGGGGSHTTTSTSYYYYGSMAFQICEGPVEVKRIWANSKLIRDPDNGQTDIDQYLTFYDGSDTQLPDPLMESYEGVGSVPAYRGLAYVVLDDLPLADFGNGVPNFEFEVVTISDSPPTYVQTKNFSHTGASTADIAQYVDGDTIWTISPVAVEYDTTPDPNQKLEARFTRAQFDIETGQLLFSNDEVLVSTIGREASTLEREWWPIRNSPYFYFYTRFTTAAGEPPLPPGGFPDVPQTNEFFRDAIAVVDITAGAIVGEFVAPGGASAVEKYGPGGWDPDTDRIYFGKGGDNEQLICSMVRPFNGQSGLVYQWTDMTALQAADPRIGEGLRHTYFDRGLLFVLYGINDPMSFARYDLQTNGFAWWNSGDPIELGDPNLNSRQVNFKNDYLFAPMGSSQPTFRAYRVFRATGQVSVDVKGSVPDPVSSGGNWKYTTAFGDRYAFNHAGQWLAFEVLYDDSVGDVVAETCERCGLLPSEYDTSLLTYTVLGYTRAGPMSGRGMIQALQRILAFDAVETGGLIKFVPQDDGSGITGVVVLADELGAHMYGAETPDEINLVRQQELEMPREVRVMYKTLAQDYDLGVQKVPHPTGSSQDIATIELPAVIDDTAAKNIARRFLNQTLYARITAAIAVPTKMLALEPTDIITVSTPGGDYVLRITGAGVTAPSVMRLEGTVTDAQIYDVDETADSGVAPPGLPAVVASAVGYMDIPILREDDALNEGHYTYGWALVAAAWPGATLFVLRGGMWIPATYWSDGKEATFGTVITPAGDVDRPWQWDDVNTIEVRLTKGTLSSSTDLLVQAGDNNAVVGIDGRWEVIGFVNVVDNGGGNYTLSRLLRARRGTEHNVGTGQVADTFVLLDEQGVRRVATGVGTTAAPDTYRFVPAHDRIINALDEVYTDDGTGSTPFAPVRIEGTWDGETEALQIRWTPRSRCAIDQLMGETYNVCEAMEQFHVEIRVSGGAAVLRTLVVDDAHEAYYSLAAYRADSGDSGATIIPALDVTVYQISAVVGRGYPGLGTILT